MAKRKSSWGIIISVVVVLIVLVGGYFIFRGDVEEEIVGPGPVDDFVQCLVDNGVKMYGSVTCSVCVRQKQLFGNSFRLIDEIECNPYEKGNQAALCVTKDIASTPTWIVEKDGVETSRLVGYQSFETLAKASGCSVDTI